MTQKFDARLREAMSADDEAFLQSLDDEPSLFAQFGSAFSGTMKFWTAFAFVLSFAIFIFSIFALLKLANAETQTEQFVWLALFLWASIGVGLTKIWFWLRMNHIATLREMQKLELLIVRERS